MQITELILQASELPALTGFYSELLGLPVARGNDSITIKTGATNLVFKQVSGAGSFYHFAINIPANKIEEAREWLAARIELIRIEQYKSDIADFVSWHARSVYFYDPAGNIVELISRFDLDKKIDDPFSPAQFLSVSEAGLVVKENDLGKITRTLLEKFHLSYFDKQPPLPQFKAIGDDEGLFIVVPENRNWFPTAKPSGIFPIEIKFENDTQQYILNI